MVREQADTDAAGKIEHMALDLKLTGHGSPEPLPRGRRAGEGTGVNQGEYNLVPSHLRHRVLGAGMLVQTLSDLLQQKVANRVPQRVINGFEVIQIEQIGRASCRERE